MTFAKRACFLPLLLVLFCARSGRADDLVSNLAPVTCNAAISSTCFSDPAGDIWGPLGNSFSTGSSSFTFDSLTVDLSNQLLTPATASALGISPCSGAICGTTTAFLLSNSSGSPGTVIGVLGSLNNSVLSGTPQDFTFDTFAPVDLQPDTRYWIELTSTDNNSWWAYDGSLNGEFFSNFEGGNAWIVFSDGTGGAAYQMEVAGTSGANSVPEPSAISLLFAGLAVLGFFAAIRRKFQMCANPL